MSYTLTDSISLVTLYPEYDYDESGEKVEVAHEVWDGGEYRYKFGSFDSITFSVVYINSSDKYRLNTWWTNNTSLFYNADGNLRMVRISNKSKPISKKVKPYSDLFKGKLNLRTF